MKIGILSAWLTLWIGAAIAPPMFGGVDLCDLRNDARGLSIPEPPEDVRHFIASIDKLVGSPTNVRLFPTSDPKVARNAAAEMCGTLQTQRWIFYDQSWLNSLSEYRRRFVLAHEIAHHTSNHTVDPEKWTKDWELSADRSAAVWLTRLGIKREELLEAVDQLPVKFEESPSYPTLAERRAKVIEGYEEVMRDLASARPPVDRTTSEVPVNRDPVGIDPKGALTLVEARKEVARLRSRIAEVDAVLTPARDSFETTQVYKARLAKLAADPSKAEYRKKLEVDKRACMDLIAAFTAAWYPAPNLRVDRLQYDADRETLIAAIARSSFVFHVSPAEARGLNERRVGVIVRIPYGESDSGSGKVEIGDPETGRKYVGADARTLRKSF